MINILIGILIWKAVAKGICGTMLKLIEVPVQGFVSHMVNQTLKKFRHSARL